MSTVEKPSLVLTLLESRCVLETTLSAIYCLFSSKKPAGSGAIVVLPGFSMGDTSTLLLRRFLIQHGYDTYGWHAGINWGFTPRARRKIDSHIATLARRGGPQSITLIGWSLGGIIARELARSSPETYRQVITLGSPIAITPRANRLHRLSEILTGRRMTDEQMRSFHRRTTPPPVPITAIYSRSDGIVAWQTCREQEAPHTRNREVVSSHLGLVSNPLVWQVILEELSAPP